MTGPGDMLSEAMAKIAPLAIPDACAEGVAAWLEILADHAELLGKVPLDDSIEQAPTFRA